MIIKISRVLLLMIGWWAQTHAQESAKTLNDRAWLIKGNYVDSAQALAFRAKRLAIESNQKEEEAKAEKTIGVAHWFKNELDSALISYQRALELFTVIGDKTQMANLYNNVSMIYNRRNQHDTSIALYQKALKINLELKDSTSTANNYLNMGLLYDNIGDAESALRFYKLSLTYSKHSQDVVYANMSSIMAERHGADSAIFYYKKALEYCRTDRLRARVLLNLGPYYLGLGQPDSANIYLERGMSLLPNKTSYAYAKAVMDQGGMLRYKKKYKACLSKYLEALTIAEKVEHTPLIVSLKGEIAKVYAQMYRWEEAYAWSYDFFESNDSLKNIENRKHLVTVQEQFEYEQNQRKISELTTDNLSKELELEQERNTRNLILSTALFVLLLLGFFWLIYKRRQDKKQHALDMKRVEIEQRMLRSQMNPHFIFNALNSIQSYVTTNQTYEAEVFLSKFSLLVRKILENSVNKWIPLEEEVETLQLYLELEKVRFQDKFDFAILTDDADQTLPIPPMLLQPFVENAILHGMKGKKGRGQIDVRFEEQDDVLICEVEDNGVGRKLDGERSNGHYSMATGLTDDRINFFNKENNSNGFSLTIFDLKHQDGTPSGTKVQLTIPIAD